MEVMKIEELLLFLGTALIFMELFVPGGVAGTIGFVLVLYAIAGLTNSMATFIVGLVIFIGLVSGAIYVLVKVIPKDKIKNKLILHRQLDSESGYNSNPLQDKSLEGQRGITISVLKPSGKIKIAGDIYYVSSEDKFIEKDKQVEIVKVSGNQILVREVGR